MRRSTSRVSKASNKDDHSSRKNSSYHAEMSYADEDIYLDHDEPPAPSAPFETISVQQESARIYIETNMNQDLDRPYDLTPLGLVSRTTDKPKTYTVDPWEAQQKQKQTDDSFSSEELDSPRDEEDHKNQFTAAAPPAGSTFLRPDQIHPNMVHNEEDIAQLRLLAGKISADWKTHDFMAPALARRIRDFQFAQEKRRKKYGDERPWGILGLYDHLSSVRTDVEWANESAIRRTNGDPYLSWTEFDESKKRGVNRPFFTYFLLFVCTAFLITSIALNGWRVEPLSANPMIGPSGETLIQLGAKVTDLIVNESEAWRLLSSTVLHAGLVHYIINMLALWFVGGAIETSHGWIAAMTIFLMSAVGGIILSSIFLPEYITVGASGGIFGFIGACLADVIMNWKLLFSDVVTENGKKHRHAMIVLVLLLDIALNSVIGLTPYVDNFTHLGGMIYGFLCGLSTMERLSGDFFGLEENWAHRTKHFVVRFTGIILSFVAIVTTLVILMQSDGDKNPCPGCTWLSCVPFPPWADKDDKWWYCDDCGRVTATIVTQPYLHLELDCPSGLLTEVNLTSSTLDRDYLERKLPSYCREFCHQDSSSEL